MPQCIYAAYKRVYLSNTIKMRFLAILSTLCNGWPSTLYTGYESLIILNQCCKQQIFDTYCSKVMHQCVTDAPKTQTTTTSEKTSTTLSIIFTSTIETTSADTIRFYNTADFIHRESDDRNENPGSSAIHQQRKTTTDTATTTRKSTSFYIYFLH